MNLGNMPLMPQFISIYYNAQVTFCLCPAVIGWGQDPCNGKYDQYWPMTNDPSKISCTYLLFWWIIMDYIILYKQGCNNNKCAVFSFCPLQNPREKIWKNVSMASMGPRMASLGRSLKSKCNAWLVRQKMPNFNGDRDFVNNPQERTGYI